MTPDFAGLSPGLLAHILSGRNISASPSLMVGDRRHDINGAHAVKMRGLGVRWDMAAGTNFRISSRSRVSFRPGERCRAIRHP
ncbi:HAD hydrolase-like protein [Bradyrhizobium liaoningense]|nr:HAD hydrolase-like protein [Bradyrhizobium liaoningense]